VANDAAVKKGVGLPSGLKWEFLNNQPKGRPMTNATYPDRFDKSFEIRRPKMPAPIQDGLIEAVDTLDLCWKAVQDIFGDLATPELALQLNAQVLEHTRHHAAKIARAQRRELAIQNGEAS
jgi:hypothetical protein